MNDSSMATIPMLRRTLLTSASYFIVKNLGLTYTFPKQIVDKIGLGDLFGVVQCRESDYRTRAAVSIRSTPSSGGQDQTLCQRTDLHLRPQSEILTIDKLSK